MEQRIVANILCKNDLVYMQDLIPKCQKFCDRIIVVEDCSTDGTHEFLTMQDKVEIVVRKFDKNFSNQRNAALDMVDNGDWVFRIDSDETPSDWCVQNIKYVLGKLNEQKSNRTSIPIYHMVNPAMCRAEVGWEIRLFEKNPTCRYINKCHEVMHGEFGQDHGQSQLPVWCALLHWKYADQNRIKYTEEFFLKNNLYNKDDWERRKNSELSFFPPHISYSISRELRTYLCSQNTSKISG